MQIARATLLNAIAVCAKLGSQLAINKILATTLGPSAYAMVGQFSNLLNVASVAGGTCFGTGLTKLLAEHKSKPASQDEIIRSSLFAALAAAALSSGAILAFSEQIAELVSLDVSLILAVKVLGVALPLLVLYSILLATVSGKADVGLWVTFSLVGTFLTLILVAFLTWRYGALGALIGLSLGPAGALVACLPLLARVQDVNWRSVLEIAPVSNFRTLGILAVVSITSLGAFPIAQMIVRNHLGLTFGWEFAGIWHATLKLSDAYLMLASVTLSAYFMPRCAGAESRESLDAEVVGALKLFLPLTFSIAILIWMARTQLIAALFSPTFANIELLLHWQLLGDIFRVVCWVLSFALIGRGNARAYIVAELFFCISFVLATHILGNWMGESSVVIAYLISNALNVLVLSAAYTRMPITSFKPSTSSTNLS